MENISTLSKEKLSVTWALCYWGLTNNLQLKARPVFSLGLMSIFKLYYKQ